MLIKAGKWLGWDMQMSSLELCPQSVSNFHRAALLWRQTRAPGLLDPPQQWLPGRRACGLLLRAAEELCEHSPGQGEEPDPAGEALVPPGEAATLHQALVTV